MSTSVFRRNDATTVNGNIVNGKTVDIAITVRGSDFYFAWCATMGAVALTIIGLSYLKPRKDRLFFCLCAAINATAFIAYFTMGSNLGWTPIDVEWRRSDERVAGVNREIFYVRYVDWFITTPLLLLDLLLMAAMPRPSIVWVIFLDWAMIVCGLIGALVRSRYKWGFFSFGCACFFAIFWEVGIAGQRHAKRLGNDIHRVYLACGVWTFLIWLVYPVAFGCCEDGNVIAPDSEAVFYGILDLCAKPIFSGMMLAGHWNIDPARMGLTFGRNTRALDAEIEYKHERGTDDTAATSTGHASGYEVNGTNFGATAHGRSPVHEAVTNGTTSGRPTTAGENPPPV